MNQMVAPHPKKGLQPTFHGHTQNVKMLQPLQALIAQSTTARHKVTSCIHCCFRFWANPHKQPAARRCFFLALDSPPIRIHVIIYLYLPINYKINMNSFCKITWICLFDAWKKKSNNIVPSSLVKTWWFTISWDRIRKKKGKHQLNKYSWWFDGWRGGESR